MERENLSGLPGIDPLRLPEPVKARWELLRAGIHNLWEYDDQRFVFHRGHLLLRGQNESGKTKALELLLPFVLDASLRPERLDPFGSSARSMRWNLINDARPGEAVIGYVWLEFGRLAPEGPLYRTIGAGLRAKRSTTEVDDWYFETDRRVDRDLALFDGSRVPLRRRQLEEAIGARGRVFEKAGAYRAAVNELLFDMPGEQYEALLRALLELRRPQLSKALDPDGLSEILRASLPPLDAAAIGTLAEGFERLDRHRAERDELLETLKAVRSFLGVYRGYALSFLKSRALELTGADSRYHAAREALRTAQDEEQKAIADLERVKTALATLAAEDKALEVRLETLRASEEYRAIESLDQAEREAEEGAKVAQNAGARVGDDEAGERRARARLNDAEARLREIGTRLEEARARARTAAQEAAFASEHGAIDGLAAAGDEQTARGTLEALESARRDAIAVLVEQHRKVEQAAEALRRAVERLADAESELREARDAHAASMAREEAERGAFDEAVSAWASGLAVLGLDGESLLALPAGERRRSASDRAAAVREELDGERDAARQALRDVERRLDEARAERAAVAGQTHRPPASPGWRSERGERAGAPLYLLCDFRPGLDDSARAGIEAALEAAGLLDAWVTPDGAVLGPGARDVALVPAPVAGPTLAEVLCAEPDAPVAGVVVEAILRSVALGEAGEVRVGPDGRFRIGPLHGASGKPAATFIGAGARERARQQKLAELDARLEALGEERSTCGGRHEAARGRIAALAAELAAFPSSEALERAERALEHDAERLGQRQRQREARAEQREAAHRLHDEATISRAAEAERRGLRAWAERPRELRERTLTYGDAARRLLVDAGALGQERRAVDRTRTEADDAAARLERSRSAHAEARERLLALQARVAALRQAHGATREELLEELRGGTERRRVLKGETEGRQQERSGFERKVGAAAGATEVAEEQVGKADEVRREAEQGFRRAAERGLLAFADVESARAIGEWSYTDALRTARLADERTPKADASAEARDRLVNRLAERHGELSRSLHDGLRVIPAHADGFTDYRAIQNGRDLGLLDLETALGAEIATRDRLMGEEEGKLFDSFLTGEAHEHVRGRLLAAHALVDRMNDALGDHPTSSGMQIKLSWEVAQDAPAGTAKAVELLQRTGALLTDANREELTRFLEQRLAEARAEEGVASLQEKMLRFLDYRHWHRFTVQFKNSGEDWKRLTKKLHAAGSGGQKAVLLHLPLFAAAAAFYDAAASTSARLIMLDEAFAGIDRETRGQLMGLLVAFDFDFLMTSFEEWGFYKELDGISTYHLARERGMPGVHSEWFLWNGREKRRVSA